MEIKNCKLEITNKKISVKLPFVVTLDFVENNCQLLQSAGSTIFCSRKKKNILTVRYNNFTYILFKSSSKTQLDGSHPSQHCNITRLKNDTDIIQAMDGLFLIVDQPKLLLNYTIDNHSCCGDFFTRIDIVSLYANESQIACDYNEENFPALMIYCPPDLSQSSPNLCCLVYRSGRTVLVGGKKLQEIESFFSWVVDIVKHYTI